MAADPKTSPGGTAGDPDGPGRSGACPVFSVHGPLRGYEAAAEGILRALPSWFGIESSIVEYATAVEELPTFVALTGGKGDVDASDAAAEAAADDAGGAARDVIGFLTVKPTSADALELHVMGVLAEWHRRGVGRALVERAAAYARAEDFALLHVKTLAASDPDPGYAATRAFYLALGFRPLEVLPAVWGPENPCLLLVKPL